MLFAALGVKKHPNGIFVLLKKKRKISLQQTKTFHLERLSVVCDQIKTALISYSTSEGTENFNQEKLCTHQSFLKVVEIFFTL